MAYKQNKCSIANVPASSIVLSNPPSPGTVGTFTFTNQTGTSRPTILPDGNYRASIARQEVADGVDAMAVDGIEDFAVFAADANHDGDVNLTDFNILASDYNTTGKTFSEGNFDYDPAGNVNLDDFNLLASRFNTSLPPPPGGPNEITVQALGDLTFANHSTIVWYVQDDVRGLLS